MSTIKIKQGDTFSLKNKVTDGSGNVNLTGWQIKSQIRDASTLIAELTPTVTSAANGEYTLTFVGDTSTWPVKKLRCDIQYTTNVSHIVSTETFLIDVEVGVTT